MQRLPNINETHFNVLITLNRNNTWHGQLTNKAFGEILLEIQFESNLVFEAFFKMTLDDVKTFSISALMFKKITTIRKLERSLISFPTGN